MTILERDGVTPIIEKIVVDFRWFEHVKKIIDFVIKSRG